MSTLEKAACVGLVAVGLMLAVLTFAELTRAVSADACATAAHPPPAYLKVSR